MGRKQKTGLDYFSFDTDFKSHPKVKMIISKFGATGYVVITELLCYIYRHKGYYMDWNEETRILFFGEVAYCVNSDTLEEIVQFSVKWGFFNAELFAKYGILTNARCQQNYAEVGRKRKSIEIDEKHDLLHFRGYPARKSVFPAEETPFPAPESTQSKVKESKVKETQNNTKGCGGETSMDFLKTRQEQFQKYPEPYRQKLRDKFGITAPIVYSTANPQEPYQDLVDVIYCTIRDETWLMQLSRRHNQNFIKAELDKFIRWQLDSETFRTEQYPNYHHFKRHFVNKHLNK